MALPFEALAPTKGLLKKFFSTEPWTSADDDALAAAVGTGDGHWRRKLDPELTLEYGWNEGRFTIGLTFTGNADAVADADDPLAGGFGGPVVPEATPNPRTIRFQVGAIHDGPSRWYESVASAADDPSASRLFAEFEDVANVLVGPDFVAVGLRRATDWERLLRPVLDVVTDEFADGDQAAHPSSERPPMGGPAGAGAPRAPGVPAPEPRRRLTRLERAWQELGSLRPADVDDLAVVQAAASAANSAHRQVAASLLREAEPGAAVTTWARLVHDPVRSVRRATVDAIVDVTRAELRPLLEAALGDEDGWVRWKALRGLVELGPEPSRQAITARAADADFRVRLEAAAALRGGK